jgi:hypothetical protein
MTQEKFKIMGPDGFVDKTGKSGGGEYKKEKTDLFMLRGIVTHREPAVFFNGIPSEFDTSAVSSRCIGRHTSRNKGNSHYTSP